MKLFMCVNYPIYNKAIGISKKIQSQIENFEKLGFEVAYSAYTENSIIICCGKKRLFEMKFPSLIPRKLYGLFRKFWWLKTVKKYLNQNQEQYDVGFVRWGAVDHSLLNTLKVMDNSCKKIIMDCHGYHKNYKGKTLKGFYIEKTTKLNGNKLSKYIDVCLTETKNTNLFGVQALPIDTGIDVEKYQVHRYDGNVEEIHMISVANEQPYHGYDRIIRGIAKAKNEKVFLHLVGKMNDGTKNLITKLGLENKVILHGYQTGETLDRIYQKCNIGVGPLAPHRIGGKEGTGIKTKEYFAIGLPYFYAGQELLVPDDYPYVLKMQSNESPINIHAVVAFYNKIKNDISMQKNMREFAKEHYSWEKVFIKALHMIEIM